MATGYLSTPDARQRSDSPCHRERAAKCCRRQVDGNMRARTQPQRTYILTAVGMPRQDFSQGKVCKNRSPCQGVNITLEPAKPSEECFLGRNGMCEGSQA